MKPGVTAHFESFKDFVPFTLAEILARTELRRQTEILRLLLPAHTNVNTAPIIGRSFAPSPDGGKVIGAFMTSPHSWAVRYCRKASMMT